MSYCTKCGAEIGDGERFCSKCGTPVISYSTYNEAENVQRNITGINSGRQSFQEMGPLVLGIISLVFDFFTCLFFPLGFIVIILAILGYVFGKKKSKETGSPQAKAGMMMSVVALVLVWICMFIGFLVMLFS